MASQGTNTLLVEADSCGQWMSSARWSLQGQLQLKKGWLSIQRVLFVRSGEPHLIPRIQDLGYTYWTVIEPQQRQVWRGSKPTLSVLFSPILNEFQMNFKSSSTEEKKEKIGQDEMRFKDERSYWYIAKIYEWRKKENSKNHWGDPIHKLNT